MLDVHIDRPRDERRFRSNGHRQWTERVVNTAQRRGLGFLAKLRSRRVLTFGQAVNAIVEQQHDHADVSSDGVEQMVAADAQTVAVTGDDPDLEIGVGAFGAGRDGQRPAMDAMESVGLQVIRESAAAADARDEQKPLARDAERRQDLLDLRQDRIVAATRAPAHVLIGGEILGLQCRQFHSRAHACTFSPIIEWIFLQISLTKNGLPWTLLRPSSSRR